MIPSMRRFQCVPHWGAMGLCVLVAACTDIDVDKLSSGKGETLRHRLENGSFDDGTDGWWMNNVDEETVSTDGGELCFEVPGDTVYPWDVMLGQSEVMLQAGTVYEFQFTARASTEVAIKGLVGEPDDPWNEFSTLQVTLGPETQTFTQPFEMEETDQLPQVAFQLGGTEGAWTFCVDDISVEQLVRENVVNGSFDDGFSGWWTDEYVTEPNVSSGACCLAVPATDQTWQGQLGQSGIPIEAGVSYTLSFAAKGAPQSIRAIVQDPEDYSELGALSIILTEEGEVYTTTFTATASVPEANFIFQLGGAEMAYDLCIDDVSLVGGTAMPVYEPDTGPRVRVNQVAYLPYGPKNATLVTDATESLPFDLLDAAGAVVWRGETVPYGLDLSSQLTVHTIDFSEFTLEGEGYTIVADKERSHPFAVGTTAYEALRVDSLSLYYTQRSGEAIDGAIAGEAYARPAGHAISPADGVANQGDLDVPCQPAEDSELYYGVPWTCDYTLDVTGGWYDAGDQGKYVVNGGISVFQLLSLFERTKVAPSSDRHALGDGSLRIPEAGNGIPDVLDEARHELEFLLKMIVPEGDAYAGMVHHKIHDNQWTGLPLLPHEDSMTRWLHRPSTAATLNLAATAAQGARIFALYDAEFAGELLAAARSTWAAALATPDLYAPDADGADGGGAYQDAYVGDEFYWAAAELYLTTGEQAFLDYILASEMHQAEVFTPAGLSWFSVAALARMDLALIPSALPDRRGVIDSVISGAKGYLADQEANGFGQPYNPEGGTYVWGSNSQILNNLVVLAAAYDLSGDEAFRQGVLKGMDYILGRNALNISYVTAYGSVFSENQHSRWYARQLDADLPRPPDGTVSGGPNSEADTWDPTANRLFGSAGCAPQFCYVDDISSWSTNELTINWNAPLAWIASFIADQDTAEGTPYGNCAVSYRTLPARPRRCRRHGGPAHDEVLTQVRVTNTGRVPIRRWELTWSYIGDQSALNASQAWVAQEGAEVTLTPWGRSGLMPGRSRTFTVRSDPGELANPEPAAFFLNGEACRVF